MMKKLIFKFQVSFLFALYVFNSYGQFAGPVDSSGTSAIHKDSNIFVNWATNCLVTRGFQDVANPSLGYASVGEDINGTGKAGDNPTVTLGDGGSAILTFQVPITNGAGPDFAVFENAFDDGFLELAFVEVSSDGINFFRFPSISNTQTNTQIGPFDYVSDATLINNLAGKYRALYGTPFDLNEMLGVSGLDVYAITHVKVIDVVGSINPLYASYDSNSNKINDPYPTDFPNGGFDLDAVGVINQVVVGIENANSLFALNVFPNPSANKVSVQIANEKIESLSLFNTVGNLLIATNECSIDLSEFESGIYVIKCTDSKGFAHVRKIIKK